MRKTLATLAVIFVVGLFVLGASGYREGRRSAGWSPGEQLLMAVGAMLVAGGLLSRR